MDARTTGALLGMIAGDAHINVRNRMTKDKFGVEKYPYLAAEMRVLHGMQQRAYCEFKCALVNKLLGTKATINIVANGPGKAYQAAHFTASNKYFRLLKSWCYPEGKKTFNELWLKHITPEGVALWYMDDGHARCNPRRDGRVTSVSTDIATYCSELEADLISRWFWDTHRIVMKGRPEKGAWVMTANTENSRMFALLVQPYIIEPMMYKLRHVADLNSHECRAPIGKCAHCEGPLYSRHHKDICNRCYSIRYQASVKLRDR